jgi:hypothetical protein
MPDWLFILLLVIAFFIGALSHAAVRAYRARPKRA